MKKTAFLPFLVLVTVPVHATAQDFDEVQIRVEQVSESIYMLVGSGGNIAGRGQSLDKNTTRWLLKGVGLTLQ